MSSPDHADEELAQWADMQRMLDELGAQHEAGERRALVERLLDQLAGRARRAYPAGRLGATDEGILAAAVATDLDHGRIVIDFGKPVAWVAMGPDDARMLAARLVSGAEAIKRERAGGAE